MRQIWEREGAAGIWPSDKPVSATGPFLLALLSAVAIGYYRYSQAWTPLQRLYLGTYAWTRIAGTVRTGGWYTLLLVVNQKGPRLARDDEVQPFTEQAGKTIFTLTEAARRTGDLTLEWQRGLYYNAKLHAFLGHWIYRDQTLADLARPPLMAGLGVLIVTLTAAIPLNAGRQRRRRQGRRLKGPELVSPRVFNRRMHADGIGFVQEQTFLDRALRRKRRVRIPGNLESSHFLVIGDSGNGKSALIRQILLQVEERDETAIVYDPAGPADYTPYFFTPSRGDFILNPLDKRMPFWTPGDELREGIDALTLAASLFPDGHNERRSLVEAPRRIFAYLLGFHPTPEELAQWMSHPEEIQRRAQGREYASMISPDSPGQRDGVLRSLNTVADAMRLLPAEAETKRRWSTLEWSKERQGWLFLTSRPNTRKRLAPLISLWLDILVLRLRNQVRSSKRPVWFILDELATLQRLPQLHTAITENRKSNNPVVLSLQGRSPLEARYGHEAEAMISQPATKIFLGTREPRAAKWISEAIGEQEIERIRETRTTTEFPELRHSTRYSLEREARPLAMASEISRLATGHGYLKCGNLVVRLNLPPIDLKARAGPCLERAVQLLLDLPPFAPEGSAAESAPPETGIPRPRPEPNERKQDTERAIQRTPGCSPRPFFE